MLAFTEEHNTLKHLFMLASNDLTSHLVAVMHRCTQDMVTSLVCVISAKKAYF